MPNSEIYVIGTCAEVELQPGHYSNKKLKHLIVVFYHEIEQKLVGMGFLSHGGATKHHGEAPLEDGSTKPGGAAMRASSVGALRGHGLDIEEARRVGTRAQRGTTEREACRVPDRNRGSAEREGGAGRPVRPPAREPRPSLPHRQKNRTEI